MRLMAVVSSCSFRRLAFKSQGQGVSESQGQGQGEGGPREVCRTLIVPPILRQFDSYLGRCEGGTALPPQKVSHPTHALIYHVYTHVRVHVYVDAHAIFLFDLVVWTRDNLLCIESGIQYRVVYTYLHMCVNVIELT